MLRSSGQTVLLRDQLVNILETSACKVNNSVQESSQSNLSDLSAHQETGTKGDLSSQGQRRALPLNKPGSLGKITANSPLQQREGTRASFLY